MGAKLTDLMVKNAEAPAGRRLELWDSVAPGLVLRIGGRAKVWLAAYRLAGRRQWLKLGEYPAVSLADARAGARAAFAKLEHRENPRAAAAEVIPEGGRETLASVVGDYLRLHVDVKLKAGTARAYRGRLERLVKAVGHKPIPTVSRRDVLDLTEGLVAEGKRAEAVYLHRILSGLFNWCVSRGVLAVSPMHGLRPPARVEDRDRVLTDAELATVWMAATRLPPPWGPYLRLLALTGQRAGEVARIRREDVDRDLWSIPDSKRGSPHTVRLPKLGLDILVELPEFAGPYLFSTTEGERPITPGSYLKGEPDPGRVRGKPRGHRPGLLDKAITKVVSEGATPVAPFRLHDLRRTCASKLAERGTAPHIIEALLNHKSGQIRGVARVYLRYDFLGETAQALATYARHIEHLVGGRPVRQLLEPLS